MVYNFQGVNIFYKDLGKKNKDYVNVFLHGWGADSSNFDFCAKELKGQRNILIDFPPFGNSQTKLKNWTLFTYANMVMCLCEKLNIKKYNIIGHSFGGRVAIVMSVINKEKINKLVLVDSAGMKPKRKMSYYVKIYNYKFRKKLGLSIEKYGSKDYKLLDNDMKKIFTSIVNEHLEDYLKEIKAKTLIVFGEKDNVTPVYMAKKLFKGIKDSQLYLIKDAGHFSFLEKKIEFFSILNKFLTEEE